MGRSFMGSSTFSAGGKGLFWGRAEQSRAGHMEEVVGGGGESMLEKGGGKKKRLAALFYRTRLDILTLLSSTRMCLIHR